MMTRFLNIHKPVIKEIVLQVAAVFLALPVFGQALMQSQLIRTTNSVINEFRVPLTGTDPSAALFGLEPVQGALVQVLMADGAFIHPPLVDGSPDPRNAILWETYIGRGTSPNVVQYGKFSTAVSPRPPFGAMIFIRIFNRNNLEESSFYGNSQLFPISSLEHQVFDAYVERTASPLDSGDNDGDGVNNSWEKSYGTDPELTDTDGDGFSDREELLGGSDPGDSQSYIEVETIANVSQSSLSLSWNSATGRLYRIESGDPVDLVSGFSELHQVVGLGGPMVETIYGIDTSIPKWYRISVEPIIQLPFQE